MNKEDKESIRFNHSDIFYSSYYNNETSFCPMAKNHMLAYVYAGELVLEDHVRKTTIHKDECVFLRKDLRLTIHKKPYKKEQFKAIFLIFTRNFLREYHDNNESELLTNGTNPPYSSVVRMENTKRLSGLFNSLSVYFDKNKIPADEEMLTRLNEAINLLLDTNPGLSASLFDFAKPWKVNILEFMNRNYMYDVSMEEIAHFTGRSLANFKRDFRKISELSPQKWLIDKRLEMAHDKIRFHRRKVSEVATEVGFRNVAHFSKAFKDKYGYAPTK